MIKISSLLTYILIIFALVGCSSQQIDEHIEEAKMTESTQKFSDKGTPEPSLVSVQPELSTPDQSLHEKSSIEKPDQSSATPADKAFEKERYYIETPTKKPTLGSQSSEHENEYRPKTLDQTTTKEDKHSETPPPQSQTEKPQTSHTQAANSSSGQEKSENKSQQPAPQVEKAPKNSSNITQSKSNKLKSKRSDAGKKTNKQQVSEQLTEEEIRGQKEDSLTTEAAHQAIKSVPSDESLDESADIHNQNSDTSSHNAHPEGEHVIDQNNHQHHDVNHTGHNGHHLHSGIEIEQTHELKKKTTRHWNMQRMIKPKNTEP